MASTTITTAATTTTTSITTTTTTWTTTNFTITGTITRPHTAAAANTKIIADWTLTNRDDTSYSLTEVRVQQRW